MDLVLLFHGLLRSTASLVLDDVDGFCADRLFAFFDFISNENVVSDHLSDQSTLEFGNCFSTVGIIAVKLDLNSLSRLENILFKSNACATFGLVKTEETTNLDV